MVGFIPKPVMMRWIDRSNSIVIRSIAPLRRGLLILNRLNVEIQVTSLEGSYTMTSIQQLFSLDGQTALVTGGTRGIGQAMAIALAEAGANILLVQVCPSKAVSILTDFDSVERCY